VNGCALCGGYGMHHDPVAHGTDPGPTRYESHIWSPRTDEDEDECAACGVTWSDCDDGCPGVPGMTDSECTCDPEKVLTVCHDIRNEPHFVGCPRWGTRKPTPRGRIYRSEWRSWLWEVRDPAGRAVSFGGEQDWPSAMRAVDHWLQIAPGWWKDDAWDEADYRRDGDQALTALADSINRYDRQGTEE